MLEKNFKNVVMSCIVSAVSYGSLTVTESMCESLFALPPNLAADGAQIRCQFPPSTEVGVVREGGH